MKNIFTFLLIVVLNGNLIYCQLLTNPGLALPDFEAGLLNPDYLPKILLEHNFICEKFANDDCISSECWHSQQEVENVSRQGIIIKNPAIILCIHEFKPNHAPRSGVIRSIDLQIYETPAMAEKLKFLIEAIGNSYPDKDTTILGNSNQSMVYRKKGSEIDVELVVSHTELSIYPWYFLVFYLYESPYF